MDIQIVLLVAAAYFLGSIPFGYLIAKIWNIDVRRRGSGNIGATNVFRTVGTIPGLIVFILDLLKGTLAIYLSQQIITDPRWIILTGLAVILGHMFPIFLKFKGGRGAATGLGVLLGIAPDVFLGAIIIALLLVAITRYVSITSMLTSVLVPVALFMMERPYPYILFTASISALIILRHIPNIKRLINKTEPKFGEKK